jgi:Holliday junction resolvasome RuvABC DNA-binding subunit
MSTDVEKRLTELRSQQSEAQRRLATAEAKRDQVVARKAEALEALKGMGYESPEEAATAAQELSAQTEAILAQIEEKVAGL